MHRYTSSVTSFQARLTDRSETGATYAYVPSPNPLVTYSVGVLQHVNKHLGGIAWLCNGSVAM